MVSQKAGLVVVALVLAGLIAAMAIKSNPNDGNPDQASKIKIGLSMATLQEARWRQDRDLFVERAGELGAEVLVQSANSSDTQQLTDVKSLLTRGIDALVMIPHDGTAMARAVELAHKAGVPVISYDRLLMNCDVDLYMTFDNIRVGEIQAQYLVDQLPAEGEVKIVRIYGSPTDNNAAMFKQGQDNILMPYIENGRIKVLHEDWAENWKPENGKKIMNAALTQHGHDLFAVLASNDGTAGGAIQALIEEGLAGQVKVTGQDADLAACQQIAQGTQSMTVYKPIKNLATAASEVAVKMAQNKAVVATDTVNNGHKDVPAILLDVVVVTKENIEDTVVNDGFHQYKDIYQ